jgi:hypothetical protein
MIRCLEPYTHSETDYIPYSWHYNRILSSCTELNNIITRRMIEYPNLSNKFKYVWHDIICEKDKVDILKSNILFLKKGFSTREFVSDSMYLIDEVITGPYYLGIKVY